VLTALERLVRDQARPYDDRRVENVMNQFLAVDPLTHLVNARQAQGPRIGPSLLEIPFLIRSKGTDQIFAYAKRISLQRAVPSLDDAENFLGELIRSQELNTFLGPQRFRLEPFDMLREALAKGTSESAQEKILAWVKQIAERLHQLRNWLGRRP
jgi:hypothetical protein